MWAVTVDALGHRGGPSRLSRQRDRTVPWPHRYRVIAPRPAGLRPQPGTRRQVTMEQFADDLAGTAGRHRTSSKPVVLCGLSMGGYVAWQFWRKYAARLRGADPLRHAGRRRYARGRRRPSQHGRSGCSRRAGAAGRRQCCPSCSPRPRSSSGRSWSQRVAACDPGQRSARHRRGRMRHGRAARRDGTAGRDSLPDAGDRRPGRRRITTPEEMRDDCRGDPGRRNSSRLPRPVTFADGEPRGSQRRAS